MAAWTLSVGRRGVRARAADTPEKTVSAVRADAPCRGASNRNQESCRSALAPRQSRGLATNLPWRRGSRTAHAVCGPASQLSSEIDDDTDSAFNDSPYY